MKVTILFLTILLTGCATVQNGLSTAFDTLISGIGGLESRLLNKPCSKSNRGDQTRFTIAPATVLQGQTVTVTACYPVNTSKSVSVREYRQIKGPDGRVDILKDETLTRKPGFWESKFDFTIPSTTPPGTYTLYQRITYGGLKFQNRKKIVIYKKLS